MLNVNKVTNIQKMKSRPDHHANLKCAGIYVHIIEQSVSQKQHRTEQF